MEVGGDRPAVDVVVPFFGPRSSLERLVAGMSSLALREGDTVTVVDNRPPGAAPVSGAIQAPERQSSYYARNRGAERGSAEWILFLDADTCPRPDLLDRYFDPLPSDAVGVLGGGIEDEPVDGGVARFATIAGSMSQGNTLGLGSWAYVQTANCAIRRDAFEQVGGFCEEIRSGGDADICFRLKDAGWKIEPRERALVTHTSRRKLSKLLRQRARMGAGAAWLDARHPGSFPAKRWPGLLAWGVGSVARAGVAAARGDRDQALFKAIDPLTVWAFELGRRLPNDAPASAPGRSAPNGAEPLPVTVVIPAYNREEMVKRALRSVQAQRRQPAEVIVVDDASSDGTARAAEDMGARVVRHVQNRGEGGARNTGIASATQPWVALLDSDDEWLPHHLETLWQSRDGHVLVASSALRCADDPARDRFHGAAGGEPLVLRSPADIVYPENPVPVSAGMYKRELALEVGGYDEQLPHCADFDFLLRCLERGTGLVRPEVGAIYHVHDAQVSSQREEMKAAHTRIACSYEDRPWFSRAQVERWRAAVAWDLYRLKGGASRALALAKPHAVPALLRLWLWRLQIRRRSSALARDGGPSLALLSGEAPSNGFGRVTDLRGRSKLIALATLARRPASFALVESRFDALAVRALGVRPLRSEDQ
jgi:GT2 family glycosyltransferase